MVRASTSELAFTMMRAGRPASACPVSRAILASIPSCSVNGAGGSTTDSHVKIHWQRGDDDLSNVLMRFDSPPDMRGSALLLLEKPGRNDMFMYLPELKRVRRVTGPALSGGMFGTDFTYAQFERLQGVARDLTVERLPDAEIDGTTVWVLGYEPADDPEFVYVKSYVDPAHCVPLKTEFFERGERLRKVLEVDADAVVEADGLHVPRRW